MQAPRNDCLVKSLYNPLPNRATYLVMFNGLLGGLVITYHVLG